MRATYDFTRLRAILAGTGAQDADELESEAAAEAREIELRLRSGRAIDWELLIGRLRVDDGDGYEPPVHEHGTHVAGIVASDWRKADVDPPLRNDIRGICPDIWLMDLRVFDETGAGDEFAILAALQFLRWSNANSPVPVVHGVNLSLSLDHEVGAYACGRTPICEECERLIGSGTVVVAAAGNEGRAFFSMASGTAEGYRQMSITDPGNASGAITVGATHRHQPHTYGVSYFSSRGPTGDGRVQARPRRARREDHRAGARLRAEEPRRDEHGRAARVGRGRADPRPPPRAHRAPGGDQAPAVRDRDRPRPRALLPGQRGRRRAARDPGGVTGG